MNSFDKYQELQEKVNMQLGTITDQVQAHGAKTGFISWPKCGDLGYVSEQLQEIIIFLCFSALPSMGMNIKETQ